MENIKAVTKNQNNRLINQNSLNINNKSNNKNIIRTRVQIIKGIQLIMIIEMTIIITKKKIGNIAEIIKLTLKYLRQTLEVQLLDPHLQIQNHLHPHILLMIKIRSNPKC